MSVRESSLRWERRKESRPAELLAAALDIFVERGFAATRLEDVAARAGVSKGTLYLYYASKEDLFKATIRQIIVPMIEEFAEEASRWDGDSADLLRMYFHAWWDHFGATPLAGVCKLMIAEANNFPDVNQFFHDEVVRTDLQLLGSILQRGIQRGEFREVPIEVATRLWIAPLTMRTIWDHCPAATMPQEFTVDPHEYIELHIQTVLNHLRPQ